MSFEFATSPQVIVGAGRAAELPELLSGLGSRVLVCTGSSPQRYAGLIGELPLPSTVFSVRGEPTVDLVRTATASAREAGADVVLAIGGGSVIDLGKAVAALLGNGGDPLDYLEVVGGGRPVRRPAVPCLAVPTTAGAGAEVTANAVLAVPEHRVKVSMRSPLMIPRVAVVDPVLTVGCPAGVTAASGLDALTQCLEPFVSARANPITDALAREGLRHAASGLRRAHADGSDLEARTDMAVCGLLGGMALANAKLGAVHGFAGVLGGITSAAHGALCAALLAPVVDANVRALRGRHPEHRALARYGEAAGVLTGNPNATVEDGISWIRETVAMLGIPTLRTFGLGEEHADEVIGKAARASSMRGNPVELSPDELGVVFASALCGAAR